MEEKFRKNIFRTGVMSLAITGLVLGMAVPVSADTSTATPALHTVQGKVTGVTQPTFAIQDGNQPAITITTDGNTSYYLIPIGKAVTYVDQKVTADKREDKREGAPAQSRAADLKELHIPANWRDNLGWLATFDQKGNFTDIQTGDRAIVRSTTDTNLAKTVLIIKAPVIQQVKGLVTISGNSIVIAPTNGSAAANLTWNSDTKFYIKGSPAVQTGQYATITYNRNTMVAQLVNVEPAPAATPLPTTTPAPTLSYIVVTPSPANLAANSTLQFNAMGTYSNSVTADISSQVSWACSNASVATITSTGLATGIANGSAVVTASLSGITSAPVTLTVTASTPTPTPTPTLSSIVVSPSPANLTANSTLQFAAIGTYSNSTTINISSAVSWSSSNTTVATINPAGLATGVAAGNSNITASLSGINSVPVTLTVTVPTPTPTPTP